MYLLTRELNNGVRYSYDILADYIKNNLTEINETNEYGWTPLMIVLYNSENDNSEFIKILLEWGANINIQNNRGVTALMLATQNSNTDNFETI